MAKRRWAAPRTDVAAVIYTATPRVRIGMAFTNIGFDVFESERLLCEQEGKAEADRLATKAAHSVEVTPTRYGIGSVTYMDYEIYCTGEDEEGETVYLDEDGNDAAFVPVLGGASALDHRPDIKAAWKTALASYCDFLDYKEDCYETVGMVLERSREIAGMKAGHSH